MSSYLALVHLCVNALRGHPEVPIKTAWLHGLKISLPRGLLVVFILFMILTLGQVLIFPLIIIASLGLMIPVILLTENKSALRAVMDAILLRYCRQTPFSGWNIMFALLTLAAIFYSGVLAISFLRDFFLHLDEAFGMPSALWVMEFFGTPFPTAYILSVLFSTTATVAVICLIPALTTATYFEVVKPRSISQA